MVFLEWLIAYKFRCAAAPPRSPRKGKAAGLVLVESIVYRVISGRAEYAIPSN